MLLWTRNLVVHSHDIIKRHAKGTDWPVFKFRLLTVEKRRAKPSTQCRAIPLRPIVDSTATAHLKREEFRGWVVVMREVVGSAFQDNITGDLATGPEGFLRFAI